MVSNSFTAVEKSEETLLFCNQFFEGARFDHGACPQYNYPLLRELLEFVGDVQGSSALHGGV
jgi:hypothetical protein